MRILPLFAFVLASTSLAAAQSAPPAEAPATHVVPFGQAGNAVELVLAAEATEPLEAAVTLAEAPPWVAVRPERQVVQAEPAEEAVAAFTFDVLASAPAGEVGVLAFEILLADGRVARHEIEVEAAAPTRFALAAPRPNPSRGRVVLPVALPEAGRLRVEAYDVLGRRVAVLHDGQTDAGGLVVEWDVDRLAPGLYVVQARSAADGARTQTDVQRLTVVR